MANDLAGNPHKIDTAGAGLLWDGRIKITRVYWFNPTTLGHTVIIQDKNGRVIWEGRAEAANESQLANLEAGWYPGYKVPTLASGTLYVYRD